MYLKAVFSRLKALINISFILSFFFPLLFLPDSLSTSLPKLQKITKQNFGVASSDGMFIYDTIKNCLSN